MIIGSSVPFVVVKMLILTIIFVQIVEFVLRENNLTYNNLFNEEFLVKGE